MMTPRPLPTPPSSITHVMSRNKRRFPARVKQQYDAYDATRTTLDARQGSGQSQELRQELQEAMQEIDQINSEHLFADSIINEPV